MSVGPTMTKSQARATYAFEVEVETMWVKLAKMKPGKRVDVYLTPTWLLVNRPTPMSVQVGGCPYTRAVTLQWFRDDCFDALESGRRAR